MKLPMEMSNEEIECNIQLLMIAMQSEFNGQNVKTQAASKCAVLQNELILRTLKGLSRTLEKKNDCLQS